MSKKIKIAALVIMLGCMAAGSVVFFLKGISKENEMEEAKETVKKSGTEVMYDYGVRYKNFTVEKPEQDNVVSKKNIEFYADSLIAAGDERSKKEIVKDLEVKHKRKRADYLKAVQEGMVVTEDEVEKGIEETKAAIEGTSAEAEIEAFCKGAELTMDEYWELQRDIYREDYLVIKYRKKCEEETSFLQNSKEFEKISDENVKEFKVVVR